MLSRTRFFSFFLLCHARTRTHAHFHSFSLFIANSPFCGGGVGSVFASHMAVPGASGADVLGIGALLHRAHAYTHTYIHTQAYAAPVTEEEVTD